tara:strand:+ start:7279 stop:7569 length:291 start_codon:yes stop_codon:yes gene_type:complete
MSQIDYFTEERSVEAVNARMGDEVTPRLREVMASLVKHLHGFVREVELTQAEWEVAIEFLTRTGQMCDDKRQEFIRKQWDGFLPSLYRRRCAILRG